MVKIDVERIPESQVELTVEVEPETVEKYVQRAYRSLVNRLNIPGFRKGKAPRFVVERAVGKDALFQEGVEKLLPDAFKQAIEQNDIHPIDQPEWEVVQQEPLILKAKVPVRPTVQLGNYQDIRLAKEEPKVTDEQVDAVIERLREQHSQWVPVERPSAMGDQITVDLEGHMKGEALLEGVGGGSLIQGQGEQLLNTKGTEYLLKLQPDAPLPELADHMVGLAPGQEKEFELTLPESYPEAHLAGKKASFHVTVHAVKEKQTAELNDEFAKMMGDFSTVAELRDAVRKDIQERTDAEAQRRFSDAVIQMAVDRSSVEVPKVMVDREVERGFERMVAQLQQQGLSIDQYLRAINKTKQEILDEMRSGADKRVRNALVLDEIAQAENVNVSPEEVNEEIERMASTMGENADKARHALNTDEYRKELSYSLWDRKVVKLLTDIAARDDANGKDQETSEGSTAETTASRED